MDRSTGYARSRSKSGGRTIDPSSSTPSEVVKLKSSTGEYSIWVTSASTSELASSVRRSLPSPAVLHSSTRGGRVVLDQVSTKKSVLGDMSIVCVPRSRVSRRLSLPSNPIPYKWRSRGLSSVPR